MRAGLEEAATPRLYRRNAFRVTGLPTDADRPAARRARNKITSMLEVGADVDLGHDLDVDPSEVARAFDLILGDPRRRLVDELFWLWDTGSATCGCPPAVHRDHDAAVRAHSRALDLEARGELTEAELDELAELWSEAGRQWGRALRRAAFWDHVRHRIAALDDRQLDGSAVDLLRDEAPVALLKPLVQLAASGGSDQGWLADRARAWPAPDGVADDLLEQAAEPGYEEVRGHLKQAADELEAGHPAAAATIVSGVVLDGLERLGELVPPDRHRRTASIRDEAAVVLNNCATTLVDTRGSRGAKNARAWLRSAAGLATDPRTVALVEQNRTAITELVDAMAVIRKQVDELVSFGRRDVARRMLKNVRARVAGLAGAAEIDEMLRELGVPVPVPVPGQSRPARSRSPWDDIKWLVVGVSRGVALLAFALLVLAGVRWLFTDDDTVGLFSSAVAENAPVGTCVTTREGWEGDKRQVPSTPCDQQHWGEVLAYVQLGANPSPHPGDEAVRQRAGYECAWHQARQNLAFGTYTTSYAYPDGDSWNDGGKSFENYATCVVHRIDDAPLAGHNLVDAGRKWADDLTLVRDLHSVDVGADPPVGACVADRRSFDTDPHAVAFTPCDRPHWGEVIGYRVLYRPEQQWPGDTAVHAAADAACEQAAVDRGLDGTYRYHITWPGSSWWTNTPDKPKYAACTVSRADDGPLEGSLG